jgi:hypothetical protein
MRILSLRCLPRCTGFSTANLVAFRLTLAVKSFVSHYHQAAPIYASINGTSGGFQTKPVRFADSDPAAREGLRSSSGAERPLAENASAFPFLPF